MNKTMADDAKSSATEFGLGPHELMQLQDRATHGDCPAALRVARYYSLGRNESVAAIPWLRRAASCGSSSVKAELVYLLVGSYPFSEIESEVNVLADEIERIDAALGMTVRSEIERVKKRLAR